MSSRIAEQRGVKHAIYSYALIRARVLLRALLPITVIVLLLVGKTATWAQNAAPLTVDPQTGVVHSQKLLSGVPLGGIGTGKVEILTDGSFAHATVMNNEDRPTGNLPGCYAAIWTRVGTQTTARVLSLNSAYALPTIAKLDFSGLAPQAQLTFPDTALPLSINLLAFSPLVPFAIKDSSFPAAAFVFRLKNTLPVPVEISVALSWEGLLGVGSDGRGHATRDRTGVQVAAIPSAEGYFGLSFHSPSLENPVDDLGKQHANASGEMALMTYPPRPETIVTTAGWNALDPRPSWWDGFSQSGDVSGNAALSGREGAVHPAGVAAVRLTLKPNDYVEIPFAVAWYAPHHWLADGQDVGHFYQNVFDNAPDAARRLLDEWASLFALTEEWQKSILFSNLPRWLARRMVNSVAPLTADSIYTRDGRFVLMPGVAALPDQLDLGRPDPAAVAQANTRQHLAANALLLSFFPNLDTQFLLQCATTIAAYGSAPPPAGDDLAALLGPPVPEAVPRRQKATAPAPPVAPSIPTTPSKPTDLMAAPIDSNSAYVLEVAQYTLWTGDITFLKKVLPAVRSALTALLKSRDKAGLPAFTETPPALSSLTLYLAAMKAGERLAELAEDPGLAAACRDAATRGAQGMEQKYWNGQFYGERETAQAICEPDQLLGQWIAYQLDLGPLLPADHLANALVSVQARCGIGEKKGIVPLTEWDPLTISLGVVGLSLRTDQAEAGIALLHRQDERLNTTVHTPWLFPHHMPGNAPAPTTVIDSDLGSGADWNLLYALEGFGYNATSGRMTLRPNLPGTWRTYSGPIFAPTFQGNLEYKPTAHGGLLNLRIDRLISVGGQNEGIAKRPVFVRPSLVLRSLQVPGAQLPAPRQPGHDRIAYVSVGRRPIGCRTESDASGQMTLTFDTELHLNAGDRLQVDVH